MLYCTACTVKAKPGTEQGIHKLLGKYQTGFGYKFRLTNAWYAIRFFRAEFMNASKLYLLKRDH